MSVPENSNATHVMGQFDTLVAAVVATWIVCALLNLALYLWFTRHFVTREEYESRIQDLRRDIADEKHRQNVVVQGKILTDVRAIARAAGIPQPHRGMAEAGPPKEPE